VQPTYSTGHPIRPASAGPNSQSNSAGMSPSKAEQARQRSTQSAGTRSGHRSPPTRRLQPRPVGHPRWERATITTNDRRQS
jgi:hypothetical protein